jgi:CheY-like chemotaxis protein
MDHMMPGMDGIEAMTRIRALEDEYFKQVPVIALTANALSGMKELFLSKGFNDYLAKPIDISKLNALMEKWVPREKRRTVDEVESLPEAVRTVSFEIEGLDTGKGLTMAGGGETAYREVLDLYRRDVDERMPLLCVPSSPEETQSFVIQVHALKSASASIGADALSARALLLEDAGKAGNTELIAEHLPGFRQDLSTLIARIGAVLQPTGKSAPIPLDREALRSLRTALEQLDMSNADLLLNQMSEGEHSDHEKQILSKLAMCVLVSEFEEAIALIDTLLTPEAG